MKNQDSTPEKKSVKIDKKDSSDKSVPSDLINDLKKGKIDPLTEGSTNLGYEERAPRKKELDQKEHLDKEDK